MRQSQKVFSMLTALALCLNLLPTGAWAAEMGPGPVGDIPGDGNPVITGDPVTASGPERADVPTVVDDFTDTDVPTVTNDFTGTDVPTVVDDFTDTDVPTATNGFTDTDVPTVIDDSTGTGNLTVTGDAADYSYDAETHVLTVNHDAHITISGTTTTDRIVVAENATATITLDGVDIRFADGAASYNSKDEAEAGTCALWINEGANLTLTLAGTNTLQSGAGRAGINVSNTASLTIQGDGTLNVTGGNCAAGIGGGLWNNAGSITIESGTINATGTADGAGIGGGHANDSLNQIYGGFKRITINGGSVTATAKCNAAGIGGNAAGIGTGCWSKLAGSITIQNATVTASTASDRSDCSAIGWGTHNGSDVISISIDGSAVTAVTSTAATGGPIYTGGEAASITDSLVGQGTGSADSYEVYGTYTLPGDFTLASGETLTIGADAKLTVKKDHTLTNNGIIQVRQGGTLAVDGRVTNTGTIQIDQGGTVAGSGSIVNNGTIYSNGTIPEGLVTGTPVIPIENGSWPYLDSTGASQHSPENTASILSNMTAWGDSNNVTWYVALGTITISQRVTVTGDVRLILADGCKLTVNGGIQVEGTDSLTIYAQSEDADTGVLIAAASSNNAGIGGNGGQGPQDGGNASGIVTINGGVVTATGGSGLYGGGAGIGGGGGYQNGGGAGGVTTINSGTVTAIGGKGAGRLNAGGAGIGGGGSSGYNANSGAGTVTIKGGVVTATAGTGNQAGNGANIGSGGGGSSGGRDGTEIEDTTFTNCVVFKGNTGTVYGDAALEQDLTVKSGQTLTIPVGTSLTIPKGVTLTVHGDLINNGTLIDENVSLSGNGSQEDPYQIPDLATLKYFQNLINDKDDDTYSQAYYKLTQDIDMSSGYSAESGRSWTPIGKNEDLPFCGHFDGDGHTISGLYINSSDDYQGLFGYVDGNGTVQNLTVSGSVTGKNYVGGVVGYTASGAITNCSNMCSVSGTENYVGGVVGQSNNEATVEKCSNTGSVTGTYYVGGVVGFHAYDSTATNCSNTGSVNGSSCVGGVAGYNSASVIDCYNAGDITGSVSNSSSVGGVTGYNSASVTNCYNTGSVNGGERVSGVVGYNYNASISNCYNSGSVSGSNCVGGVVGYHSSGSVSSCYNTGSVSGAGNYVGGVVGQSYNNVTVENCYYAQSEGLAGVGNAPGNTGATSKTAEEFASGEVAWLLQSGQAAVEGTVPQVWGQALHNDGNLYPVLISLVPDALQVYQLTFRAEGSADVILYGNSGNVPAPADPVREGYTFEKWDGYRADMSLTTDTVFPAVWTANPSGGDEEDKPSTPSHPSSGGSGGGSSDPSYSPSVDVGKGGDVSTTPRNPHAGDKVTITVDPDDGYEVDQVIVTDRNGSQVDVTDNGDGTYTFEQPRGRVTISVTFRDIAEEPAPLPFTDVDEDAWYYDAVAYIYTNGLMSGTSETTFAPDMTTSRAMIATILWRMAGSPQVNYLMAYDDVAEGSWYTEAIRWATSAGVVSGYGNGLFGPEDPITREQMAAILYRYAQSAGYDVSIGENTNILSYADAFDVSAYAVPALQWACGAGIINGTGDGSTLSPQDEATRAQAAAMLMRFCQRYIDNAA